MNVTVNTLEQPGEFDAATKLRPGEPYFMLVGHDPIAAKLTAEWADLNRTRARERYAAGEIDDTKLKVEFRQSSDAEEISWAMDEYRKDVPLIETVHPEASPEEPVKSYNGVTLDPETAERDRMTRVRNEASRRLHEARSQIAEAMDVMRGDFPTGVAELEEINRLLEDTAEAVKPFRAALEKTDG